MCVFQAVSDQGEKSGRTACGTIYQGTVPTVHAVLQIRIRRIFPDPELSVSYYVYYTKKFSLVVSGSLSKRKRIRIRGFLSVLKCSESATMRTVPTSSLGHLILLWLPYLRSVIFEAKNLKKIRIFARVWKVGR